MRLAHANAPYFQGSSLLMAADCSAFACPSISEFIKGRRVLIGCPKLDEAGPFSAKLAEILSIKRRQRYCSPLHGSLVLLTAGQASI
jgi:hypothetical protein